MQERLAARYGSRVIVRRRPESVELRQKALDRERIREPLELPGPRLHLDSAVALLRLRLRRVTVGAVQIAPQETDEELSLPNPGALSLHAGEDLYQVRPRFRNRWN